MEINNPSNIFDVIVIGSGPAGSSAAYYLAAQEANVLVLEKNFLPRYKTCGGGVVNRIKSLLPINFDEIAEINCNNSEIYDHNNKLKFTTQRDGPIIIMTMREKFDYHILSLALKAGAKIKEGTEVVDIKNNNKVVEVKANNTTFYGRFVILSSGATGININKLGLETHNIKMPALEYEVFVNSSDYERFSKSARFDFDIVPHGYGWVFPKKDHLSIGVINIKSEQKDLNNLIKDYFNLLGIKNVIKSERHGYFVPLNFKGSEFAKYRIILTGDAAGLADPVTGEGISHAIESGRIAAEALIESEFNESAASYIYNKKIKDTILREIKFAKVIAALVYTYPVVRKLLFKLYGQKLSELITDIFVGDNTYKKLLTSPVNYLKLIKYLLPIKNSQKGISINMDKETEISQYM
jgi:geranylgeranyl reductase family protein